MSDEMAQDAAAWPDGTGPAAGVVRRAEPAAGVREAVELAEAVRGAPFDPPDVVSTTSTNPEAVGEDPQPAPRVREEIRKWLGEDEVLYVGSMEGDDLDSLAARLAKRVAVAAAVPATPPPDHRYTLHIDPEDGLGFKVECNYDPADETRPCWPHDEDGTRIEGKDAADCTFVDWASNCDAGDILWGELDLEVDCDPKWRDDYISFHLRGLAAGRVSSPTPPTREPTTEEIATIIEGADLARPRERWTLTAAQDLLDTYEMWERAVSLVASPTTETETP